MIVTKTQQTTLHVSFTQIQPEFDLERIPH
jgi:hypothetical protein